MWDAVKFNNARFYKVASPADIKEKAFEIAHTMLSPSPSSLFSSTSSRPPSSLGESTSSAAEYVFNVTSSSSSLSPYPSSSYKSVTQTLKASIRSAADFVFSAGIASADASRTVALVARSVCTQLYDFFENGGNEEDARMDWIPEDFADRLETLAVDRLEYVLMASCAPATFKRVHKQLILPTPDDLLAASTFLGDLFAAGIVQRETLTRCIETFTTELTAADHLFSLHALYSRAFTFRGLRVAGRFHVDMSAELRRRCMKKLWYLEPERDELLVHQVIEELLDDINACRRGRENSEVAVSFTHEVDTSVTCDEIFSGGYGLGVGEDFSDAEWQFDDDTTEWQFSDTASEIGERLERLGILHGGESDHYGDEDEGEGEDGEGEGDWLGLANEGYLSSGSSAEPTTPVREDYASIVPRFK